MMTTPLEDVLTEGERDKLYQHINTCQIKHIGTDSVESIIKRLGGEVVELQKDVDCEKDMRLVFSQKRIKQLEAENAELKAKLNEGG